MLTSARARQYIILNLGLSENFGAIDYVGLEELWPVHMVRPLLFNSSSLGADADSDLTTRARQYVDYVRVYQPAKAKNIGALGDPLLTFGSARADLPMTGHTQVATRPTPPPRRTSSGASLVPPHRPGPHAP